MRASGRRGGSARAIRLRRWRLGGGQMPPTGGRGDEGVVDCYGGCVRGRRGGGRDPVLGKGVRVRMVGWST